MIIGLVLPSTPNYSESFFIHKIKGLQENGFSIVLFVRDTRKDFTLCKVQKMPKVYKNKVLLLLQSFLTLMSFIPHFKQVVRFYKLEKHAGSSTSEVLKKIYLNAHLLKAKLDWVHFGFATQAIGSEFVAKAIGAKMAVSFRGFDINVYPLKHQNCYLRLWQNVDKVHSISQYLLDEAIKLGLDQNIPSKIITPAVDFELLNKEKALKAGNRSRVLTICTVARLNWIKNLSTAIETMSILVKKYPTLKYAIIGDGSQKEKERYLFLVHQLGLETNVMFYSRLSHSETLSKIYNSDIYLQTSLNEGFCNAVLEAQALGKLVVASNVGGLKENIVNNETGWLVDAYNADAFASIIEEVKKMSSSEKNKVTEAAKNRVKKLFTKDIQIQEFIDFYKF